MKTDKKCPNCGELLYELNGDLYCENSTCYYPFAGYNTTLWSYI